jgi:hypothetical protein
VSTTDVHKSGKKEVSGQSTAETRARACKGGALKEQGGACWRIEYIQGGGAHRALARSYLEGQSAPVNQNPGAQQ